MLQYPQNEVSLIKIKHSLLGLTSEETLIAMSSKI